MIYIILTNSYVDPEQISFISITQLDLITLKSIFLKGFYPETFVMRGLMTTLILSSLRHT